MFYLQQRYHRSVSHAIYNPANSCNNLFAYNSVEYEMHSVANLLPELLMLRDHVFCFSNGFLLSHRVVNIEYQYRHR